MSTTYAKLTDDEVHAALEAADNDVAEAEQAQSCAADWRRRAEERRDALIIERRKRIEAAEDIAADEARKYGGASRSIGMGRDYISRSRRNLTAGHSAAMNRAANGSY